jgi:hypothetical protein
MFKRTILALAVAAIGVTGVLQAQENVTLVMRSGERLSAQLVDLGGVGFTVRVNGQERQIPTNDVAVIDFAGGDVNNTDWSKVNDGAHVVWLRNGQTVSGQMYDISGTSPLRITFRTNDGQRELSSSEIGRIVLARPANAVAATTGTTAATAGEGAGLVVSARQQWTPTGITVRRGETLSFATSGEIQLSSDANDVATPNGVRTQRFAGGAPLPNVLAGALIGRVGNGRPFGIGTQTSVPMPEAGQLFLGINDDNLGDNQGEFRVQITRQQRRR